MFRSFVFLTLLGIINGSALPSRQEPKLGSSSSDTNVLLLNQYLTGGIVDRRCSATLISPKTVLTSASCLIREAISTTVTYGCFDTTEMECKEIPLIDWIKHPKYVDPEKSCLERKWNDLAVGQLAYPILSDLKSLTSIHQKYLMGEATLVGWREDEENDGGNVQQFMVLPIDLKRAASEEKIFFEVPHGWTEEGYSGGPLFINDTIYGVASYINREEGYLVYMCVAYYHDFITNSMNCLTQID